MKHIFSAIMIVLLSFSFSFAQLGDMDLTDFGSISDVKKEIEPFTDAFHSGLNVLTFTSAEAPSVFGISLSVFTGFSSIEKNPDIGLTEEGFTFSTLGVQAGFGTAGFEIYARYFPEFKTSGFNIDALGFGLKYDLSDMIPVTGFPSTALYGEYNTQSFGVNDKRNVTVDNGVGGTISGTVQSGIDMSFSTINIGAIVGYDLIIIGIYGKLGVEIGNTNLPWNQAVATSGQVVKAEKSGDIETTAMRYAVGLTLFGFRAEIGGRGSNTSAGLGYGISF
jgi:Family of unknown function (DUF6588)